MGGGFIEGVTQNVIGGNQKSLAYYSKVNYNKPLKKSKNDLEKCTRNKVITKKSEQNFQKNFVSSKFH